MTSPSMQQQTASEINGHSQFWSMQEAIFPERQQLRYAPTLSGYINLAAHEQRSSWIEQATTRNAFSFNHGLPLETFDIPQTDLQTALCSYLNDTNVESAHTAVGKMNLGNHCGSVWSIQQEHYLPGVGSAMQGSDRNTNTSATSPESFFTRASENERYSSVVTNDRGRTGLLLTGFPHLPSVAAKQSNPVPTPFNVNEFDSYFARLHAESPGVEVITHSQTYGSNANAAGESRSWVSGVDTGAMTVGQQLASSSLQYKMPNSDHWQMSSILADVTQVPNSRHDAAPDESTTTSLESGLASLTSACAVEPPRSYVQTGKLPHDTGEKNSSQTSGIMGGQEQRKAEDRMLLEGKAAGLTFKEIRKRMRSKVAESTLRGRYRSLTKPRKDRVRKPVWTSNDIQLLKEKVRAELDKFNNAFPPTSRAQRQRGFSWKAVAEYISENGGSYCFGNTTCKKKWEEIQGYL